MVIGSTRTTQVQPAGTRLRDTRTRRRAPTQWVVATRTRDGTPMPDGVGVRSANLVHCKNINLCKNNYYYALSIESAPTPPSTFPHQHTGIADSGSSGYYFSCIAPFANYNPCAPTIGISVANGCSEHSVASATLAYVSLLPSAMMLGHVMPSFPHTLIGLGPSTN